jgi:membrane-associated phospholipid phosphatase
LLHPKKEHIELKNFLLITIGTIIASIISLGFIDKPLALSLANTSAWVINIFTLITHSIIIIWIIVVLCLLDMVRKWRRGEEKIIRSSSFILAVSVFSAWIGTHILKFLFGRYRPELLLTQGLYGFSFFSCSYAKMSFPSAHTTTSLAFMTVLSKTKPKYKVVWIILAILLSASRVILNEHYLSDVLVGGGIGVCSAMLWMKDEFVNW